MSSFKMRYTPLLLLGAMAFSSCEDLLKTDPLTSVNAEDHYTIQSELYAAYIGIAGSFVQVAEQTIILTGLKGDLMRPTNNASEDLWNIYRFQPAVGTPFVSTQGYYDIVINCNDFLRRAVKYKKDYPTDIPDKVYRGLISSAINYKVWSLMTIAKINGSVDIYNSNLTSSDKDVMLTLSLDEAPDFLLEYMRGGVDGINAFHTLDWKLILNNVNVNWVGSNIEGRMIEGELLLWMSRYEEAFNAYRQVVTHPEGSNDGYRDLSGTYRGKDWKNIFSTVEVGNLGSEVITLAPYNAKMGQQNILKPYFSSITPGKYLLAPTKKMMNLYESQERGDYNKKCIYRGLGVTYKIENNVEGEITKYALNDKQDAFTSDTHIPVYRVAEAHLGMAEALCFMGRFQEAFALLDEGIKTYWNGTTYLPPFKDYPANLKNNIGTRTRANLLAIDQKALFADCQSKTDSVFTMSKVIADEIAMEFAYEGKRWFSLMRLARNLNEPDFLAKEVAGKFGEEGDEAYRTFLRDPANWFIK